MKKYFIVLAAGATLALATSAYAGDDAYPNGRGDIPGSSTAATPHQVEQSPGTVGAMKDADKGGFSASTKSQDQEHLNGNKGK